MPHTSHIAYHIEVCKHVPRARHLTVTLVHASKQRSRPQVTERSLLPLTGSLNTFARMGVQSRLNDAQTEEEETVRSRQIYSSVGTTAKSIRPGASQA